jgi:iron complex outermembrane recepter protein
VKTFNRVFGAALFASVSALGMSSQAFAQAADDASSGGLDEIIVTAQKRGENLQKTPIAISAISSEQLDLQQIAEAKDLGALAPNVSVVGATTNATAMVLTIRGIPTAADETQGYDSPIGIYVDGVYMARSSASTFEVADVERVEVLRGPQGTLFGRNTTGGAVNFITRLPGDEANMAVRFGGGNFGQLTARAILDTGDLGGVKMSIGGLYKKRNGVVDNILEPRKSRDPGAQETRAIRFAATADLTDNITLTNIFDWSKINGLAGYNQLAAVGNGAVLPNYVIGGNTFAAVQPANVLGYLNSATSLQAQCGTPVSQISSSRRDTVCSNTSGLSTDKLWGNMTRLTAEFDGITVRSTTAFRRWTNLIRGNDIDGMGTVRGSALTSTTTLNGMPLGTLSLFLPAGTAGFLASQAVPTTTQDLFNSANDRRQKQFSQEVELISNGDGPFQWVIGGFYFKESGHERNNQNFLFVVDTNQAVFTTTNFGPLAPLLQAGNPARYRGSVQATVLDYDASGESYAVYGQGTYRFGAEEQFGLTFGMRYSWDSKTFQINQNGAAPFTIPAQIAINGGAKKFNAPTGNLTLDYRANEDINLYARVARGYRSGGFNARQTVRFDAATPANNVPLRPFDEEKIDAYEVGFKTEFNNRIRVNGAFFYNIYRDQLVTLPIPITGGGSFGNAVFNAGKTNYYGMELEGRFALSDNFLLDGAFGYVKTDPKDFPQATTTGANANAASVFKTGYSPKYTANVGATYTQDIGASKLTARVGYNYTSSFYMFGNPITSPFSEQTKGDARGLLDAQLRVDNLLGSAAEGLSLTLWGKNLTNKDYVIRSVDFGALGYATTIYGDPRTYGLTLDMKF